MIFAFIDLAIFQFLSYYFDSIFVYKLSVRSLKEILGIDNTYNSHSDIALSIHSNESNPQTDYKFT